MRQMVRSANDSENGLINGKISYAAQKLSLK